jgi:hypothetical protein
MTQDTGGPAFPESGPRGQAVGGEGMTLRDYFAAKAMQSLVDDRYLDRSKASVQDNIAQLAYQMADAMLKARG